jgi:hypothetical protein
MRWGYNAGACLATIVACKQMLKPGG